MKRCPECDKELPDYQSYCIYCGADLENKNDAKSGFVLGYASFGKRLLANIIDYAFLFIFFGMITFATHLSIGIISAIILMWLYFSYMESSVYQATVGKRLLGLKVTDERLERISFPKACIRFLFKLLSLAMLGVGFLILLHPKKRKTFHDKFSNTFVLYENKYNKERIEDMSKY